MGQDEGRRRFGQLVRRYRAERGVSLAWVASMLSHPPHGQIWTGTGIRQLQNGERKITRELADQLIVMLGMDPDEAYEALGWWPRDVSRRDIVDLRHRRGEGSERRSRRDEQPGDVPAAVSM
jgi:Helix-turn-helix domain